VRREIGLYPLEKVSVVVRVVEVVKSEDWEDWDWMPMRRRVEVEMEFAEYEEEVSKKGCEYDFMVEVKVEGL